MSEILNKSDLHKIRSVIDNARREVNRNNAPRAIRLLEEIAEEISSYEGTPESVEYLLLTGEAFSARGDAMAEDFFKLAEEKAAGMSGLSAKLLMRLFEHHGKFHASVSRKLSQARPLLERAKKLAVDQHIHEDIARIDLEITCLDLQTDADSELENFKTLRRVGDQGIFTCTEQYIAWLQHLGSRNLDNTLRFARGAKKRSDDYFHGLLDSIRNQKR